MSAAVQRYNVGGVFLPRPFKVRRLGHFGFNVEKLPEGRAFYGDLLGFTASDTLDFSQAPWFPKDADLGDPRGYFMRYGTDHHAFVLFPKRVMDHRADRKFAPEVTINQITWQCGSLKEIADAHSYFEEQQVRIQRVGRDMPGSNWHVYVYDPDGHTNEFYYGIEQIGWNQLSKPRDMYYRGFNEKPDLPQMSEAAELAEAYDKGIAVLSGHQPKETLAATYDVEGVLLPRPFKITKVGPVEPVRRRCRPRRSLLSASASALSAARRRSIAAPAAHSCAAAPSTTAWACSRRSCGARLGLSEHTTCMSFGVEVGSYAQLRAAVAFLKEHGVTFVDSIPPELYPGIDYSAFALDPDGHCIQLYYYMEQIGWDGRVRPAAERRRVNGNWPEALEPLSDTYVDQVFQGPLG